LGLLKKMNRVIKKSQIIIMLLVVVNLVGCASLGFGPSGLFVQSEDDVNINYSDTGQGETALVFVHGWMCDRSYWQAQVDYFSTKYQVVALDLAGHGQSGLGREDYTIEKFSEDVVKVVNQLQLKKAILIGHSMGGSVVMEAAVRLPNIVTGVVAVDSFATGFQWPENDKIPEMVAPFRADFKKETYKMASSMFAATADKALVDEIASDMASAPKDIGVSAFVGLLEWVANDYERVRVELSMPFVHVNAIRKNMPIIKDKIVFVSDVGHFIPQEAPKQFNEALEQAIVLMQP
jgi:pimeloyl-ACP methyl ester carboxylesterase